MCDNRTSFAAKKINMKLKYNLFYTPLNSFKQHYKKLISQLSQKNEIMCDNRSSFTIKSLILRSCIEI